MNFRKFKISMIKLCLCLMFVNLTACTSTVTVPVKQHCPQIPKLSTQYQPVTVNAVTETEQNFRDYISDN